MCSHYHLSGKSDEHRYDCTRKKGANMSGNIQRREIHPMDTSSGAETHPVPPALHMIRPGTSRVLPVHLSKHHSLVVAFMKQSDTPPAPFNAVSNISLDDFCTFCFKALRIRLANLLGLDRIIFDSYKRRPTKGSHPHRAAQFMPSSCTCPHSKLPPRSAIQIRLRHGGLLGGRVKWRVSWPFEKNRTRFCSLKRPYHFQKCTFTPNTWTSS